MMGLSRCDPAGLASAGETAAGTSPSLPARTAAERFSSILSDVHLIIRHEAPRYLRGFPLFQPRIMRLANLIG
jgi:hypothetical protein